MVDCTQRQVCIGRDVIKKKKSRQEMLCVLKSKEKCDGSPELQGPTVDTTIPVPITVKKTAPQK